ncbi:transcriptional regulator, MarR family protein [Frankia sp. R43]|uniref:MarR family winged helix-turn-helix transcriptional regulator n=1 Tax=Frankia sp. R43 TaxID=269536 RepID=UPI0006CA2AF0|nr:MarR family transcriptional regulator [Frankia sp. R43]KPM51782.1 transcriptional regulator, MarR family protein [Frankia sp. R43]
MDEKTAAAPTANTGRAPAIRTTAQETPSDRGHQVAQLADDVARLIRGLARARSQFLARARDDMEWAAQILISYLAAGGPMRLGALAAAVQSDPSTVSRQVAALVRDGFVERRADPADGRAVVLDVTEAGRQVHRDHIRVRNERYEEMLAAWSSEDLATFAALLHRFGDAMEIHQPSWSARPHRSDADPDPATDTDTDASPRPDKEQDDRS